MNWDAVFWILLAIVGAGLIVFGIVMYRGATTTNQRASGAGLAAVGAAMYLVLGMTLPFSASDNASPAPTIKGDVVEPTPAPTTTNVSDGLPVATETSGTVEPMQLEPGDIAGLLLTAEVSKFSDFTGELSTRQIDSRSRIADSDPEQVAHMNSFDTLTFTTPDGTSGLTLAAIDFVSDSAAADHVALLLDGFGALATPIGDVSGGLEVNGSGIGSMVAYQHGEWAISLHTAQPDGTEPLVTFASLQELARIVDGRLP